ncbi:MAG TPA: aminoglycoside phosphotransferase family protein [Bacteroidales bacterium]|nr:aminoglycoside phosphotransferase family protein [Bacteroidales bacterium]
MTDELKIIFSLFKTEGTYSEGQPFGSGHIHDTFLIRTIEDNRDDYILQRLNNNVFRDIPSMQDNIGRVTEHIRCKLMAQGKRDLKRECLTPVPALDGKNYLTDDSGAFWRIYIFISDHRSYDIVDNPDKAYQGGKAIGRFQALLSDLPPPPLHETIPFFHNVEKRLTLLHDMIKSDPAGRVKEVVNEIGFIEEREDKMKIILQLGEAGRIPVRITHNDTKFNNVLFDSDDRALCIIDLDTVMPGYVHYDFGDAIRTAANTASEDEVDLSLVGMDIALYSSFARGYLEETIQTLNSTEVEHLAFSPQLITYIMGLRFLTDYIDGDRYFRIHHKHHNLQRAKAQFKLVESMESQYPEMKRIITDIYRNLNL